MVAKWEGRGLQNLYESVRFRPTPPISSQSNRAHKVLLLSLMGSPGEFPPFFSPGLFIFARMRFRALLFRLKMRTRLTRSAFPRISVSAAFPLLSGFRYLRLDKFRRKRIIMRRLSLTGISRREPENRWTKIVGFETRRSGTGTKRLKTTDRNQLNG